MLLLHNKTRMIANAYSYQTYQFLIRFHNKTHLIELKLPIFHNRVNIQNGTACDNVVKRKSNTQSINVLSSKLLFLLSAVIHIPSSFVSLTSNSLTTLHNLKFNFHDQTNSNPNTHIDETINKSATEVVFLTAKLHPSLSSILGGKGGFGTLLKNQSKQSGAKITLDFGACRDLNGRRLRHVNDEIKLRKWREKLRSDSDLSKKDSKDITGWHLDIPNWASAETGREKARKRQDRLFHREMRRQDEEREKKRLKKEAEDWNRELMVLNYANKSTSYENEDESLTGNPMQNAIKQGLKKRMRIEPKTVDNEVQYNLESGEQQSLTTNEQYNNINWLCSLSGELNATFLPPIQMQSSITHKTQIEGSHNVHSKYPTTYIVGESEFSTACILLPNLIYYEVTLETSGLLQIGFADLATNANFSPNSDTGDGVGDDAFSYGYDPNRNKIFHNSQEFKYGSIVEKNLNRTNKLDTFNSGYDDKQEQDKKENVIGCWFDTKKNEISFFRNGKSLGRAFTIQTKQNKSSNVQLMPAFSLNQGEVIGIRLGPHFQYNPCVEILSTVTKESTREKSEIQTSTTNSNLNVVESANTAQIYSKSNDKPAFRDDFAVKASQSKSQEINEISLEKNVKPAPSSPKYLDLSSYGSMESLLPLGMERLKCALLALGVKCG